VGERTIDIYLNNDAFWCNVPVEERQIALRWARLALTARTRADRRLTMILSPSHALLSAPADCRPRENLAKAEAVELRHRAEKWTPVFRENDAKTKT